MNLLALAAATPEAAEKLAETATDTALVEGAILLGVATLFVLIFRRLGLGAVHEVVGGAVHDHVRPQVRQRGAECIRLRQVGLRAGEWNDLTVQPRAEIAPQLAGGAQDGVTHR